MEKTIESLACEVVKQAKYRTKLMFIALIIALTALIGTNAYWIYTINSYEYVYQDGSGQNNYNSNVGGDVQNVTAN